MSKTITIDENEFMDIMAKTSAELANGLGDVLKFGTFCVIVHKKIFGKTDENNTDEDTEAPFKYGDKVFVIDNEGDGNHFVNRVVTVVKVCDDDSCEVTDGGREQYVYFKNLRKVKTS